MNRILLQDVKSNFLLLVVDLAPIFRFIQTAPRIAWKVAVVPRTKHSMPMVIAYLFWNALVPATTYNIQLVIES